MCWMGLCVVFGLKFGLCVIARFRKLRGTNDNGWFCGRGGNSGAVGVSRSSGRSILFIDDEKIPKNAAISMLATLASLFTCVYSASGYRFLLRSRKEIL